MLYPPPPPHGPRPAPPAPSPTPGQGLLPAPAHAPRPRPRAFDFAIRELLIKASTIRHSPSGAPMAEVKPGAAYFVKMSSGKRADTTKLGTSTVSLSRKSAATEQIAYAC